MDLDKGDLRTMRETILKIIILTIIMIARMISVVTVLYLKTLNHRVQKNSLIFLLQKTRFAVQKVLLVVE
jgi:hypothetical protein